MNGRQSKARVIGSRTVLKGTRMRSAAASGRDNFQCGKLLTITFAAFCELV